MKWLLAFAVAVVPLSGSEQGSALPPIALYTQFSEQPAAELLEALQLEVQTIMAPLGLRFRWQDVSASDGKQEAVELAVIEFKGRCGIAGWMKRDLHPGPLAWTHISDGVILPFADVDCSAVRSFIETELMEARSESRVQILGRALGRVVAHELYHIFANTTRHGSNGVGREFYRVRDLLSPDFQFQTREIQALINSNMHSVLVNALPLNDETEHR